MKEVTPLEEIDWPSHIEAWESSGLSQTGYCEQKGLSYGTFKSRRQKFLKEKVLQNAVTQTCRPSLKPVSMPHIDTPRFSGTEILLELPANIRLTIRSSS